MRIVLQRVTKADVTVDGKVVGAIGAGLLALVAASATDTGEICSKYAEKIFRLRIFSDSAGKTNLSAADIGGGVLIVSQFTLYADTRKGNRPSFIRAGSPEHAAAIIEQFAKACQERFSSVATGVFGAHMSVSLVNDGPFTIILDSDAP